MTRFEIMGEEEAQRTVDYTRRSIAANLLGGIHSADPRVRAEARLMSLQADTDPTSGKATTVGEYGATGAMHQASIGHALAYKRLGWDEYRRQLLEREKAEATDGT